MKKPRVFISYAWEDRRLVDQVQRALARYDVSVWMDSVSTRGGDNLPERISNALEWSDLLLLFWSSSSSQSRWVSLEWTNAVSLAKRIILCVLDSTHLPGILTSLKYIRFDDYDTAIAQLCEAIPAQPKPLTNRRSASPQARGSVPAVALSTSRSTPDSATFESFASLTPEAIASLLGQSARAALGAGARGQLSPILGSCRDIYEAPGIVAFREFATPDELRAVVDVLTGRLARCTNYLDECMVGLPIIGLLFSDDGYSLSHYDEEHKKEYVEYIRRQGVAENVPYRDLVNKLCGMMYDCWV